MAVAKAKTKFMTYSFSLRLLCNLLKTQDCCRAPRASAKHMVFVQLM